MIELSGKISNKDYIELKDDIKLNMSPIFPSKGLVRKSQVNYKIIPDILW
jgi:hypothetical protein